MTSLSTLVGVLMALGHKPGFVSLEGDIRPLQTPYSKGMPSLSTLAGVLMALGHKPGFVMIEYAMGHHRHHTVKECLQLVHWLVY